MVDGAGFCCIGYTQTFPSASVKKNRTLHDPYFGDFAPCPIGGTKSTMKTTLQLLIASSLLAALATAQPHPRYQVTDLGTLGGSASFPYGINNAGIVAGGSNLLGQSGNTQNGFVWKLGHMTGIGTLAGPSCTNCSSQAAAASANGTVAGISDTGLPAPDGEDFCEYGTHIQCVAVIWKDGKLSPLPLLQGGNNSEAYWMNNLGEAVGVSENGVRDNTCSTAMPFQVYRYEAVKWTRDGQIHKLRPLPGDTVSFAFGVNDEGQAVGLSGLCENVTLPPFQVPAAPHAVRWERDGTPTEIHLLPGVVSVVPATINNWGEIVGAIRYEDGTVHGFLWTSHTGMQDLGVPDETVDFVSVIPCCGSVNNRGEIVGFSCPGPAGTCRALLYSDHKWQDLNALTLPGSPYLTSAASINDAGDIVAGGFDESGNPRAYLVSHARTKAVAGPKDLIVTTGSIRLDGTQSTSEDGKPLVYVWTILGGSHTATITDGNSSTPTVTFNRSKGIYNLELTVTDSNGHTSSDVIKIVSTGF
jgi:probable HAF family extracellular repeat protein